jgi:hypothetical protein
MDKIVICPDFGCIGCEHGKLHALDSCDSSCGGGGDNNCPSCVNAMTLIEQLTSEIKRLEVVESNYNDMERR